MADLKKSSSIPEGYEKTKEQVRGLLKDESVETTCDVAVDAYDYALERKVEDAKGRREDKRLDLNKWQGEKEALLAEKRKKQLLIESERSIGLAAIEKMLAEYKRDTERLKKDECRKIEKELDDIEIIQCNIIDDMKDLDNFIRRPTLKVGKKYTDCSLFDYL